MANIALIIAGGVGARMGQDIPKQFINVNDRPVIIYTYLLGLTTYGKYEIEETVDFAVYVPRIDEYFAGSLAVVPLQLLGYYVSVAKGLDVDKPRNLAKSVTVE